MCGVVYLYVTCMSWIVLVLDSINNDLRQKDNDLYVQSTTRTCVHKKDLCPREGPVSKRKTCVHDKDMCPQEGHVSKRRTCVQEKDLCSREGPVSIEGPVCQ